jgi:hypothetical protein
MGTWYEIERFYVDYEANGKCTKVEYNMTPDGRVGIITTALDMRNGRPLVSYGLATFESGELAKMSVRLSPRPSTPNPEEFPYHVLDTDYSSYALVASCKDLCKGKNHAGEDNWNEFLLYGSFLFQQFCPGICSALSISTNISRIQITNFSKNLS